MFRLGVRDRFMIAHSFRGEVFGPAQQLHGGTYIVDVEFVRPELDEDGLVVDIGLAHKAVSATLAPMAYKNLDELPEFEGINTTTEFLARYIYRRLLERIHAGELGETAKNLQSVQVMLRESDVAWASFEGPVR